MDDKHGLPQVCEAVTIAAHVLAHLERNPQLDERDRAQCEQVRAMLHRAEQTLYGWPQIATFGTPATGA